MSAVLENKTILVVDDHLDTGEFIRTVLEDAGASVVVAQSAVEALEVFRRSPTHVVITDVRLGSSDGYELIHAIRESNQEYRGFTPVVAVTGFASPEDKERAIAAGFGAYVSKPFNPADLVKVVEKLLNGPSGLA